MYIYENIISMIWIPRVDHVTLKLFFDLYYFFLTPFFFYNYFHLLTNYRFLNYSWFNIGLIELYYNYALLYFESNQPILSRVTMNL